MRKKESEKTMKHSFLCRAAAAALAAALLAGFAMPAAAEDAQQPQTDAQLEQQLVQKALDAGLDPNANPQQENSWRYENGELREEYADEGGEFPQLDLPEDETALPEDGDGAAMFSVSGRVYGGIDVSHHQGGINWTALQNQIDFAIPRCGYGLDLMEQDDRYWRQNANECQRLGIPFGTYVYSYATNTAMAKSEAEHALRLVQGYDLDYPIYIDIEDKTVTGLSAGELSAIAKTFCETIEQAGYTPGIYTFKNMWDTKLTDPSLKNRGWSLWLAHWQTGLDYSRSGYDLWQFGTANIAGRGIDGNIGYLDPMTRGTADINEDGESDLRDVLLISTMLAGRMDTTNRQRRAADVDKNGTLNTADVQALAEMLIED